MLAQGTPLHVVSEILRHASVTITKDVCGHPVEKDRRASAQFPGIGVKPGPVLAVAGGRFQACRDPADESRAAGRSNLNEQSMGRGN